MNKIEIRRVMKPGPEIDNPDMRELWLEMDVGTWVGRVPTEFADKIARLQRDSEALAVAKDYLESIGEGNWNREGGPGFAARAALARIQEIQGAGAAEQQEGQG